MSTLATNAITDASGGNTATINGQTPTESNMAGRNRIINGGMEISQRGTSFTSSSAIYTLDRWKSQARAGASVTTTQEANQLVDGSNLKVLQFAVTTPASDGITILNQYVENAGIDLYGKTLTISWYAKITSGSATVKAIFEVNTNTQFVGDTNALTGDWQRFSYSFVFTGYTYPTSYDHGRLLFHFTGAAAHTIQITGVQLEAGSVATPFERRSYGQELALCQRYYQKSYDYDTVPGTNTENGAVTTRIGATGTATQHPIGTRFVVTMRATPTMVVYSRSGTSGSISNLGTNLTNESSVETIGSLRGLGTTGLSYITFGSSFGPGMSMQYTADAEL